MQFVQIALLRVQAIAIGYFGMGVLNRLALLLL